MVRVDGNRFVDDHGRRVILRGVNLGGSSKVPKHPDGATHLKEGFYEYRPVSFVGRPFPPPEADEHFGRLRQWGFNCVRFIVPWEAIEHAGPGQYDLVYLDYVTKMIAKAGEYDLAVFIDPHQDVWSRWTGGDGAPAWTLEAAGFDLRSLHESGAAFLHQEAGDPYPTMRWVTNYNKLAAATMFTLFFGGDDFAPQTMVDGEPIQQYLQRHYFAAVRQVARRVKDMPHVLGYDTLNEPHSGYIGVDGWHGTDWMLFADGPTPTMWQSLLLGAGVPQEVAVMGLGLTGQKETGREVVNPHGRAAWRENAPGVWRENGVWRKDGDDGELLRPDHFTHVNGRKIDFNQDYMRPFIHRFAQEIRAEHPDAILFAENALMHDLPDLREIENAVNAGHWYDAMTLFTRRFLPHAAVDTHSRRPVVGRAAIEKSFAAQLAALKMEGEEKVGGPTLVGEFGISFDLNERIGYEENNFEPHLAALDRTFRALEANLLSGTLWNYTADNDNQHGDGWNGEDLSIFSRDQQHELERQSDWDAGGRAIGAFCRPYPRRTAGEPQQLSFDRITREFVYTFRHDPQIDPAVAPTEIYVPDYHYSVGVGVEVSDGEVEYDHDTQTLLYRHTAGRDTHTIRLFRQRGPAEVLTGRIPTGADDGVTHKLEHVFVNTNGITLHTVQAGPADGEVVLLLHGFPEFWYGWRLQIPYLVRQGYRVVAPDLRGYNLSDKPRGVDAYKVETIAADVIGLIEALGVQDVHLVSHDWGAVIGWWVAAVYPSRVKKAVMMNVPHPHVMHKTVWGDLRQFRRSWYAMAFQVPAVPEWVSGLGDWEGMWKFVTDYSAHPDTFTAEDEEQYKRTWGRPGAMTAMMNWYRAFVRYPPKLADPRVRVPTLVIWGAQDVALLRKMANRSVERYCDDGRVVFIEEATHWSQIDEPDRVNILLKRFLEER